MTRLPGYTRMRRAMLEQHRQQAEQHVALGRRHIARQIEIVAELERDGMTATTARHLLKTFESMQECHEAVAIG